MVRIESILDDKAYMFALLHCLIDCVHGLLIEHPGTKGRHLECLFVGKPGDCLRVAGLLKLLRHIARGDTVDAVNIGPYFHILLESSSHDGSGVIGSPPAECCFPAVLGKTHIAGKYNMLLCLDDMGSNFLQAALQDICIAESPAGNEFKVGGEGL